MQERNGRTGNAGGVTGKEKEVAISFTCGTKFGVTSSGVAGSACFGCLPDSSSGRVDCYSITGCVYYCMTTHVTELAIATRTAVRSRAEAEGVV